MRKPPIPVLSKSSGAFDLPSIITGVVVVGILAAGVLAAIFGVIPFAQDRGAKQDLSSIRTAEGVAKAKDNRFMDHQGLLDIGYLQLSSTETTKVKADAKGTCYVGIAKSGTGTLFYSTDTNTDPQVLEADTDPGCLTDEELADLIDDVGGIEDEGGKKEDDAPDEVPESLKLVALSPLEAKATWGPLKGATGYKIEYRINDGAWTVKSASTTATSTAINAMPEDTISVRVTALIDSGAAEPMLASVKLPDSVLKNPSFEDGLNWWTAINAKSNGSQANTGKHSAYLNEDYWSVSQVVTVPSGTPALTFRSILPAKVSVNGTDLKVALSGAPNNGSFAEYMVDMSAYTGKLITLKIAGGLYVDDVTLRAPMASSVPLSVAALSRSSTATVSWTAPDVSGGVPVTSYTATAWSGTKKVASVQVDGDRRSATLTGLTVGVGYAFTAEANNAAGTSVTSDAYGPVVINAGPIANPGFEDGKNKALRAIDPINGWTVDKSRIDLDANSGDYAANSIEDYWTMSQVITVPSGTPALTFWSMLMPKVSADGKDLKVALSGAAWNGQFKEHVVDMSAYAGKTITLKIGGGLLVDDVAMRAPMASSVPLSVAALSRSSAATVSWTAPDVSGGVPVTSYTATAWSGTEKVASVQVDGDRRSATMTGLKVGVGYAFTAEANNAAGTSVTSDAYGPVVINAGPIANPGFEDGKNKALLLIDPINGWTADKSRTSSSQANSGDYAANSIEDYWTMSQVITVPSGTPALTFWSMLMPKVSADGKDLKVAPSGAAWNGQFKEHVVDMSAHAGKTITLKIAGGLYVDDVTLK